MRMILGITLALATIAAGCGDDDDSASNGPLVVASTTHVTDFAQAVAGDSATVDGIVPTGADPHDYEPQPSDVEAIADAALILRSGGELDAWLDQVIESSGSDAPVVTIIDSIEPLQIEEGGETVTDPHWFQDPQNVIVAVEEIRDALIDVDGEAAADYEANAADYITSVERLDREIARCIDRLDPQQRKLVTSHDALGYYARRYGLEVVGAAIPALTTQAQASAGETAELVETIEREGVAAVFPEVGVSATVEAAVAEEAGAAIGGELWADALGPAGSSGATYLEAMAADTATLVEGLSGGALACAPQPS
jgi:zinc/manganese transport system substrate-binding protein